jgi:glycosyltransferase involved in cell wall biosynthesis
MRFSIVIASLLAPYPGAAHNREEKLLRAVASAQQQTFKDFEIIVVADGCQRTMELVKDAVGVRSFLIARGRLFAGGPRNKGIDEAKGDYIVYLDIDDLYGENHLSIIDKNLNGKEWVWFNDIRYYNGGWRENFCDIYQIGKHGTSNICHRRDLGVKWNVSGYAHDYHFVRELLKHKDFVKIETPEYYVCHVPGTGKTNGYEI